MKRSSLKVTAAALVSLGIVAAACGDDSKKSTTSSTTATSAASSSTSAAAGSSSSGAATTTASSTASSTATTTARGQKTGGTITIGAEQWPDCVNVITECSNSSWMVWTTQFVVTPAVWQTTADGDFKITNLVDGEPTVSTGSPFTVTVKLNPKAVWDDGSPITSSDIKFTWRAVMDTKGSNSTAGYDQITDIDDSKPDTAVIKFKAPYAAYKTLFDHIIKKAAFKSTDVSGDMQDMIPFSARPFKMQSWSKEQLVLVPNDKYWGDDKPLVDKIVIVPREGTDAEINSLKSGEVDFIFPQAAAGFDQKLNDPNIKWTPGFGTNYEALWFQQRDGVLADKTVRTAFMKSIDRQMILDNIYKPLFPDAKLLNCGLWVPNIGKWCQNDQFANFYNQADADKLMTDAGYKKGSDGFWQDKSGKTIEIKWVVNTGNKRRENTQALLIPALAKVGWKVTADNTDAATYFQKRLPSLQYTMAMYINTAQPDPSVTNIMSCSQVPSDNNNQAGQNSSGWCDEAASKLMDQSDQELDVNKRVDLIHQIGKYLVDDAVMLPLFQFPNIAAWRTDKIAGPIGDNASNYIAFAQSLQNWSLKK